MREIVSPLSGIRSPFGARRNPLAAYRAGGFTPKLVAAFADEFYAKEGRKSTFDGVLEPTATTNGTMVDSDGLLKWRPHNEATNPTAPATQTITVVSGADYTVECTGVSIALSGAGTGTVTEGSPVEITAGSTSLTLTVTGSTGTITVYRSDLGGMVNNPDTGTSFVPTTGYLPRRGHHIYNGSAWVDEGVLIEPSTQTNKPHGGYSAPKNGTTNVTGLTISDDAGVGFAGAGTGPRVTGSGSAGTQRMHLGVGDATYRSTAQVYIAKSSTHKYYQIINSNDVNAYVNFDLNDGSLGNVGSAWSADGIVSVVDHETFYELIVNDTVAAAVPRYLYFVDSKTASWAASSATSDYGDIPYVGNIHQSGADNTYPALPIICTGAQVARAGEQLVLPHESISWPSGDELSIHIQGRMTGQNSEFVRWRLDANNYISLSSGAGDFTFSQSEGGTVDSVTGGSFTSGTNVSFNIASRHGSTFVNGAVEGTALTEDTTPTSLPDLETTNLQLAYSGGSMVLKEVSLWDVNLGDAGTEDATEDISDGLAGGGVLNENGNWNDTGAWSGSEDFDGTSGADLQVEINDWLTTQDNIDSRLDALEA